MTVRAINVRDAHIKTASVEAKTLTVGGKQVTMGVFRQLKVENILGGFGTELRGTPWGTVNYFPKPCEPDHLHVVWQKGGELRRSCVYEPVSYRHEDKWARARLREDRGHLPQAYIREWFDNYPEDVALARERFEEAVDRYRELEALDQLFIAV
jgi:hypothetical protein